MSTKIDYFDGGETWNFIGGCSPCATGCKKCWAARQAAGRLKNHPLYKGLTKNGKWTGEIRLCTDINRQDLLEKPQHWYKPRRIGVQFMGDLFHKNVPNVFIDTVFNRMWAYDQHIYYLLTKRAKRMQEHVKRVRNIAGFPLNNVYCGTSISTQEDADKNIPELLKIPGKKWLSIEPMLGEVRLLYPKEGDGIMHVAWDATEGKFYPYDGLPGWVVVGCESLGKRVGRPCKLEWIRSIVRQCSAANVPCYVKQIPINGKVSHDPKEWPEDLRVRENPDGHKKD